MIEPTLYSSIVNELRQLRRAKNASRTDASDLMKTVDGKPSFQYEPVPPTSMFLLKLRRLRFITNFPRPAATGDLAEDVVTSPKKPWWRGLKQNAAESPQDSNRIFSFGKGASKRWRLSFKSSKSTSDNNIMADPEELGPSKYPPRVLSTLTDPTVLGLLPQAPCGHLKRRDAFMAWVNTKREDTSQVFEVDGEQDETACQPTPRDSTISAVIMERFSLSTAYNNSLSDGGARVIKPSVAKPTSCKIGKIFEKFTNARASESR
ncbi:hypothetical protein BC829DRAFT_464567 [Chytridium lagenaria]|nr:hypothetical protein BC829DRAFT_464567 [Chytridium lagenaria]